MQLEVKGLKYWKDDPLLLSLPWGTFVTSGHGQETDSPGFEPGGGGTRKTGKVFGGDLRGFKCTAGFLLRTYAECQATVKQGAKTQVKTL